MSNLHRYDEVQAIKVVAARSGLRDTHDNGVCLVLHAQSTDVLLGCAEQLTELGLGGMKNLVPSTKGYDLFVQI